ncbi:MAG: hypothetical protein R3F48_02640 [Candidatus Zixiibacteriota bacterium]
MHPTHHELRMFCTGVLKAEVARRMDDHIRDCGFCAEFCEEYRNLVQAIDRVDISACNDAAVLIADDLYREAIRGRLVSLLPFRREESGQPALLAADGVSEVPPRLENIATFFSEDPEMILRLMRDTRRRVDYVQLVSDDPAAVSHVLVEAPEARLSILTDEFGRGNLDRPYDADLSTQHWQIKMPDVEFTLSPFDYHPDRIEYAEDVILETSRKDKVAIRFEGRTAGQHISVRVLELHGTADFGPIRVAVSQQGKSLISSASGSDSLYFDLDGADESIQIRLFRD